MTVHAPPSTAPNASFGGSGVAFVITEDAGVWQVVCDICGRHRRGRSQHDLGLIYDQGQMGARSPDNHFLELSYGNHSCTVCWRKRNFQKTSLFLPDEKTIWWSRVEPRRIIRVVSNRKMQIQFEELYSVDWIGVRPPKHGSTRFLLGEHFHDIFAKPEDIATPDDMKQNREWSCLADTDKVALVDCVEAGKVHLAEPFAAPDSGITHTEFEQVFFLHHFIPLWVFQPRTWHQRLTSDDFPV